MSSATYYCSLQNTIQLQEISRDTFGSEFSGISLWPFKEYVFPCPNSHLCCKSDSQYFPRSLMMIFQVLRQSKHVDWCIPLIWAITHLMKYAWAKCHRCLSRNTKLAIIRQGSVHERLSMLWYPSQVVIWLHSCTEGWVPPGHIQRMCCRFSPYLPIIKSLQLHFLSLPHPC